MADCVQIMKENSQAIFFNLKKSNFALKNATKACLGNNDGSILCVETTDVDVTRVLLVQVLINLEKDTILNDNNLNEILFTDFSSFTTMTSGQNEDFKENFPDLLVCILDNEEELSKQSHILESWINIIKLNGQKIIFIMKNPKHLEKIIMDNQMANIFNLKVDKLWKQNEILSNNEAICEVENNLVNIESTSARALDESLDINLEEEESLNINLEEEESLNINLEEEESKRKTSSHGEATTDEEDLKNLLQSLGVAALDSVNSGGNTQLHLTARDGKTEIVESLLVHGAKKDLKNHHGQTALHFAAKKGHSAIVQMLFEHGCDVNATDRYNCTPLHFASTSNDAYVIEILLIFGAEIERIDVWEETVLHFASYYGRSAVVNSLLNHGANINAQNYNGDTPLHKAISANKQEIVLILLQHGALLNIENKQQQNALDYARFLRRRNDVIKILEEWKEKN